jgi:ABC-type nitrate/sulfonate/bicarbonate transport system substrate-binding protein
MPLRHHVGRVVASALVSALLWLSGCSAPSEPMEKVRIAVSRTPLSAPLLVAQELGYFADNRLDVEWQEVIGGHLSFNRVMEDAADIGTSSDTVLMFNAFKRQDFVNLSSFVQSNNDVKIVVRADLAMTTAADLLGRRVAVVPGSASEYFFHTFLLFSGIDSSAVETLAMKPEDMSAALRDGRVDGISIWEPYAYKTVLDLGSVAHVIDTKGLYSITFNLVAKRDYAQTHGALVTRFLNAICRAARYINDYPAEAQRIVRQRLDLSQRFIDWIWPDYLFRLSRNHALVSTLENEARWAIDKGLANTRELPDFRAISHSAPLSDSLHAACSP